MPNGISHVWKVILVGDKEKKALNFNCRLALFPVLLVSKVHSWNRFQIEMCWQFCWLSKARGTSTKQRPYFCNDQLQKEHDACTKAKFERKCDHLSSICSKHNWYCSATSCDRFCRHGEEKKILATKTVRKVANLPIYFLVIWFVLISIQT